MPFLKFELTEDLFIRIAVSLALASGGILMKGWKIMRKFYNEHKDNQYVVNFTGRMLFALSGAALIIIGSLISFTVFLVNVSIEDTLGKLQSHKQILAEQKEQRSEINLIKTKLKLDTLSKQ